MTTTIEKQIEEAKTAATDVVKEIVGNKDDHSYVARYYTEAPFFGDPHTKTKVLTTLLNFELHSREYVKEHEEEYNQDYFLALLKHRFDLSLSDASKLWNIPEHILSYISTLCSHNGKKVKFILKFIENLPSSMAEFRWPSVPAFKKFMLDVLRRECGYGLKLNLNKYSKNSYIENQIALTDFTKIKTTKEYATSLTKIEAVDRTKTINNLISDIDAFEQSVKTATLHANVTPPSQLQLELALGFNGSEDPANKLSSKLLILDIQNYLNEREPQVDQEFRYLTFMVSMLSTHPEVICKSFEILKPLCHNTNYWQMITDDFFDFLFKN